MLFYTLPSGFGVSNAVLNSVAAAYLDNHHPEELNDFIGKSDVDLGFTENDSSSEFPVKLFRFLKYRYNCLEEFLVTSRTFTPEQSYTLCLRTNYIRNILYTTFCNAIKRKVTKDVYKSIHELFISVQTYKYMPDSDIMYKEYARNSMKNYFIPGNRSEINLILNSTGANMSFETENGSVTAANLVTVKEEYNSKVDINDINLQEIISNISGASSKQFKLFMIGASQAYSFYDLFSYIKYRVICNIYNNVCESCDSQTLLATVTKIDSNCLSKVYRSTDITQEWEEVDVSSPGLETRFKKGLTLLEDLFVLIERGYTTNLLSDFLRNYVSTNNRDHQLIFTDVNITNLFLGIQSALDLKDHLEKCGVNIFNFKSAIFTYPVLSGLYTKLDDYIRNYPVHRKLVTIVKKPNPRGSLLQTHLMMSRINSEYLESYKERTGFYPDVKTISVNDLIKFFYHNNITISEQPESLSSIVWKSCEGLRKLNIIFAVVVSQLLYNNQTIGSVLFRGFSSTKMFTMPSEITALHNNIKNRNHLSEYIYLDGIGVYSPIDESKFSHIHTDAVKNFCSYFPGLNENSSFEVAMSAIRSFLYTFSILNEIYEITSGLAKSSCDFSSLKLLSNHRVFLNFILNKDAPSVVFSWYANTLDLFATISDTNKEFAKSNIKIINTVIFGNGVNSLTKMLPSLSNYIEALNERNHLLVDMENRYLAVNDVTTSLLKKALQCMNSTSCLPQYENFNKDSNGYLLTTNGEYYRQYNESRGEVGYIHQSGEEVFINPQTGLVYF